MAHVGRNEPCPCGSGRKFKHCCLNRRKRLLTSRLLVVALIGVAGVAALVYWNGRAVPDTSRSDRVVRNGTPSWSPDGSKIVFYSDRDGNGEIYLMNADSSDPTRLTNDPADEGYPTFSPDGGKIAFDTDRDGNFDIYVMNADGSDPRRLTNDPARDVSASWSPDGSRIAFMSDRDGGFEIYAVDADGSNLERLTNSGSNWFPRFSPDGTKLAFHVGRDVNVMSLDGTGLARLTTEPHNGMYPSWSPDGEKIAFMSWRDGQTEIYMMNADGSDQTRLTRTTTGEVIDPRLSPDGSKIVYVHVPAGMAEGPQIIHVMDADGSNVKRLTR